MADTTTERDALLYRLSAARVQPHRLTPEEEIADAEQVIRSRMRQAVPQCSFCGKDTREVRGMIAAGLGRVFICDECVRECIRIFRDEMHVDLKFQLKEPGD